MYNADDVLVAIAARYVPTDIELQIARDAVEQCHGLLGPKCSDVPRNVGAETKKVAERIAERIDCVCVLVMAVGPVTEVHQRFAKLRLEYFHRGTSLCRVQLERSNVKLPARRYDCFGNRLQEQCNLDFRPRRQVGEEKSTVRSYLMQTIFRARSGPLISGDGFRQPQG